MRLLTTKDVGRLIAVTRKGQGLTQAELAQAIGASRYWVIRSEQGQQVDLGLTLRALRVLGVSLETPDPGLRGKQPDD